MRFPQGAGQLAVGPRVNYSPFLAFSCPMDRIRELGLGTLKALVNSDRLACGALQLVKPE